MIGDMMELDLRLNKSTVPCFRTPQSWIIQCPLSRTDDVIPD